MPDRHTPHDSNGRVVSTVTRRNHGELVLPAPSNSKRSGTWPPRSTTRWLVAGRRSGAWPTVSQLITLAPSGMCYMYIK